jgi:anti-sigma B factor antagonist
MGKRADQVVVSGELDIASAPQLRALLEHEDRDEIAVDLSRLTFMDATGLRVLLEAARRAKQEGRSFSVVNPRPPIRRLFALTAVERTLDIRFD